MGCGIHYEIPSHAVFVEPKRPKLEVANIVAGYLDDYLKSYKLSPEQYEALRAIRSCRTRACGAHILKCDECDYVEISYNSCRNRHCPKCQGSLRRRWINERLKELLPVPYYHMVFTLPHELNDLCLCNKRVVYDLFFAAAAESLQSFAADEKYLGAEIGFTAVLHSWGQQLPYHVHLHMIVSGGGISLDGKSWKNLPYREQFIFPVKAMSKVMRGIFIQHLKGAYGKDQLKFPGLLESISPPLHFEEFCNMLATKEWVIYSKKPFRASSGESYGEEVLEYISKYVYKTAISNHRLLDMKGDRISFGYKDYRDGRKNKIMNLPGVEFLRRFLLHVLPKGFKKVRHYGILAPGKRGKCLDKARQLLQAAYEKIKEGSKDLQKVAQQSCPNCGKVLRFIEYIAPYRLCPHPRANSP